MTTSSIPSEHQQWHAAVSTFFTFPVPEISTLYLESVQYYLSSRIVPRFVSFFRQFPEICAQRTPLREWTKQTITTAISEVHNWVVDVCEKHFDMLAKRAPSIVTQTRAVYSHLCEAALSHTPYFDETLTHYLHLHFTTVDSDVDSENSTTADTSSNEAKSEFLTVCRMLRNIHLTNILAERATALLLHDLEARVLSVRKVHTTVQLPALRDWLQHSAIPWLSDVLSSESVHFSHCSARLCSALYTLLANLRIAELFDVIVNWPESRSAIVDLKECLTKTNAHNDLVITLQRLFQQRVLHSGASTHDITECYVKTIRVLTALDPSGVLLHATCPPMQHYLRQRPDTVRTIVTLLTHDSEEHSVFFNEFEWSEETTTTMTRDDESSDDDDNDDNDNNHERVNEHLRGNSTLWHPKPLYAQPGVDPQSQPAVDILSMLINIYGSKELFVNEYLTLLAERLLNVTNFETDRELRHVELLKKKFGESHMHKADIMLKDMTDSKRLNAYINQQLNTIAMNNSSLSHSFTHIPLTATIISGLFWPPFRDEPLTLHPTVQQYTSHDFLVHIHRVSFETYKQSRKLVWKPQIGSVELEVSLAGHSEAKMFTVSPLLATILLHFQDQPTWPRTELAAKVGISPDALKRKIMFWIHNGIIREADGDVYQLRDCSSNSDQNQESGVFVEEENGEIEGIVDREGDDAEVNQLTEMYVINMLKNLGAQPLDKLHNILSNYVPGFQKSIPQLAAFLDLLIKQDKLDFTQGLYTLKK